MGSGVAKGEHVCTFCVLDAVKRTSMGLDAFKRTKYGIRDSGTALGNKDAFPHLPAC